MSGIKQIVTIVFLLAASQMLAAEPRPFESDGCSAFPDGTLDQQTLWLSCCHAHDYTYWRGGTYPERKKADLALKHCVDAVGEPEIAVLMLAGVRVGGTPYLPTKFRWGYAWPFPRGYKAVTPEEENQLKRASGNY